jgi:biopolymer transport protein ExbB/TolQ
MDILTIMNDGGWVMWVLLGVAVLAGAVSVERVVTLYLLAALGADRLVDKVALLVEERRYADALAACKIGGTHPLPRVLKAGIERADQRDAEIEKAMEAEMLRSLPRIQRLLPILGLLANLATLLGLLGTIFGLILAFSGVSAASAADRQAVLADGISVAMYTTAMGIIVAVPAMIAHNLLVTRSERVMIETEQGASRLLAALGRRLRVVNKSENVA